MKHTPGPWAINGYFIGPKETIFNGSRNAIARTPERVAEWGHYHGIPTEEDTANARLIAASPDLLEAIHALLNCPDLNLDELDEISIAAIKQAQAALAEAEGRS